MRKQKKIRIAAFGFRSLPFQDGGAGADKFAEELLPRLVKKGFEVTAYNRMYKAHKHQGKSYKGVKLVHLKTVESKGYDSFIHSFKCAMHIILFNTGNTIHIQNGGNSIWAFFLRLFGKKVFVSQDGVDWKREKWPLYIKMYLRLSAFITAHIPNHVIFDNIFARELFEKMFNKKFDFIPFGSEINYTPDDSILKKLNLKANDYFLFIGRFIPDKGLQYLIPAFEKLKTNKKLVLIGGSPNASQFELDIKSTKDERILFPGYVYGNDVNSLIKNAYTYIQPSDVEGLSPMILSVMGLDTPLIVSDIKENLYVVDETAVTFKQGNIDDLTEQLKYSLKNHKNMKSNAVAAKERADTKFSWDTVVDQHIELFTK